MDTDKEINGLFRTCLSAVDDPRTAKFVESLSRQWDNEKWLSDKQVQTLKRIHDDL